MRPDHSIASVGYNGHEPGGKSCLKGECPRGLLSASECPPGSSYDTVPERMRCESLHAESNCLANAREDTTGMVMYVSAEPCAGCLRQIRAHRLGRVVWPGGEWTCGV
jgi:dCMP deaminase